MKIWLQWTCMSLCLFCLAHASPPMQSDKRMKLVYAWKSLEFDFPSEAAKSSAIRSEQFIPGAPVPIDVDVYERANGRPKVFITIPRFQSGVPVTVGYVTDRVSPNGDPIIAPYPSWEWNKPGGNCNGITSVYRVKVDACKRIWILDTGKLGEKQVCPPQLLSFSLENDRLLSRYVFPSSQYKDSSLFVTPVIDIPSYRGSELKCQDTHVYVADVTGFALLAYSLRTGRSWKIYNKYFYPYPKYGTFHIKEDSFDLMDGILGMALSPVRRDGDRILFFHSLASVEEGWVKTSVIKNETRFKDDAEAAVKDIHVFDQTRSSQSAPEDVDRNGVMYFGLMSDLAIGCWNTNDFPNYGGNAIQKVVVNSNTMQFASGLKVVPSINGHDNLWVLTSSFQKYMTGRLRRNEINFRIQAASTDDLVRGTRCASASSGNDGIYFPDGNHHEGHNHGHYVPKPYYPSTTPYPTNYPNYPNFRPSYQDNYPGSFYPITSPPRYPPIWSTY